MKQNNNILYFNLLVITVVSSIFYINNLNLERVIIQQNTKISNMEMDINLNIDTIIKDNNKLKSELAATRQKQSDLIYTLNELGKITSNVKLLTQRVNSLSEKESYTKNIKRRLSDLESNDIVFEKKLQVSNRFLEKNIINDTNQKIEAVTINLKEIITKIKEAEIKSKKQYKLNNPRKERKKHFNNVFLRDYLLNQ